ncbi:hypothetical protein [Algivirga pacifica]|uniref:Uncharacterized protein n=1 Tax=Algivirga pacifica TaxID=1162670 RepID=A0ABP9DEX9_9BACT
MKAKFTFEIKTKEGLFLTLDILNSKGIAHAKEVVHRQCPGAKVMGISQYKNGRMVSRMS